MISGVGWKVLIADDTHGAGFIWEQCVQKPVVVVVAVVQNMLTKLQVLCQILVIVSHPLPPPNKNIKVLQCIYRFGRGFSLVFFGG